MKTKLQKQKEVKKGTDFIQKSQTVIFTDFGKVKTNDLKQLRKALKEHGADYLVIKKRLLSLILKEKGIDFNAQSHKFSVGTVFSNKGIEDISAPVVKFFSKLGEDFKAAEKVLGAYNLKDKSFIEGTKVVMIGNLPSREVLLSQLLGMIQAPISSLLYIMKEKSKQVELSAT
ncbi:MAG: 50S ribosomal protein L10 [Patescibacteria group bacterium]